MRFFISTLVVLPLLVSCKSFNKLSNQNLAPGYDYRETILHPEFALYHSNDSTTVLYGRIHPSELLAGSESPDYSGIALSVAWAAYESYDAKAPSDSASAVFNSPQVVDDHCVFNLEIRSPLKSFILEVKTTDLIRKKGTVSYVVADKSSRQSRQRYLLTTGGQQVPLFRNHVRRDERFRIYGAVSDQPVNVRCYFRSFPLAAPPFANNIPVQFDYRPDSVFTMNIGSGADLLLPERGIYHFQYDTSVKHGVTVFRFNDDYPKLTDAGELIESLRYLTTHNEYDRLLRARNKKEAVDEFWLELAGNQDRARTLIRKYYTRIQEANRLFTSYLEGWKTDRGMIYTIMGSPTSVFRTAESEEWTFGNYNDISAISFTFEKIYNPFTDDDYILRRSGFYEDLWYRMVDRWRQGAAIND